MSGIVEDQMKRCKLEQDAEIVSTNQQLSDIQTNYVTEEEKNVKVSSHTALNQTKLQESEIRQFLMGNIKFTKQYQQLIEQELEELEVSYES